MHEFSKRLIKHINKKLSILENKTDKITDIRINVFKTASLCLEEEYTLPQNDINGIREMDLEQYINRLVELIPGILKNCNLLPRTYLMGNHKYLYFVRLYQIEGREYLYVFKVFTSYLGGAEKNELVKQSLNNISAAVRTNKIYFECLFMPISSLKKSGDYIIDFTPLSIITYLQHHKQTIEKEHGPINQLLIGSIVFDDPDFSRLHQTLTSIFADANYWKLHNIFWPIMYRHTSICIYLIFPFIKTIENLLPEFDNVTAAILDKKSIDFSMNSKFWQSYFKSIGWENSFSRSNNREYIITEDIK